MSVGVPLIEYKTYAFLKFAVKPGFSEPPENLPDMLGVHVLPFIVRVNQISSR